MIIIINTKNYVYGKELEKLISNISNAMVAVPATEIKLGRLAQHVDLVERQSTGYITAEAIKSAGAYGTLLNHSEHKLEFNVLKKTIEKCKKLRLATIVCGSTVEECVKIAKLQPDIVAYEDPKLIGKSKAISVADPSSVEKFVKEVRKVTRKVKLLCGAGISKKRDIQKAKELGCHGVLISSAIVKAKTRAKINEIIG